MENKIYYNYQSTILQIYNIRELLNCHNNSNQKSYNRRLIRQNIVKEYLKIIDSQYQNLRFFHITGTSGKGSTAHFVSSLLSEDGLTGLITSPHIFDPNERIKLNNEPIPHNVLVEIWFEHIFPILKELSERDNSYILSFPEIIFLIGIKYFLEKKAKWAVIEAGMGGRSDYTNFILPEVSIITNVSLDHTNILGDNKLDIAYEKAGIIKENTPFFTSETDKEVLNLFEEECKKNNSKMYVIEPLSKKKYSLQLHGIHQQTNAFLAVNAVLEKINLNEEQIKNKLKQVQILGRFQKIDKNLYIDIAHNEAEIKALVKILKEDFSDKKKLIILGIAKDKRYKEMLSPILELLLNSPKSSLILTQSTYRGESPQVLLKICQESSFYEKIAHQINIASDGMVELSSIIKDNLYDLVIITGSTFLIDELLNPDPLLKQLNTKKINKL